MYILHKIPPNELVARLWIFTQTRIFITFLEEIEPKQKIVLSTKYILSTI